MTAPRDLAAEARAKADAMRTNGRPATALLLTELADRIDELEAERDEARADAGRAHGQAGACHARKMELLLQLTARDKRIAELEAAQREPIGYVIGTVIGTDPGRVELYGDQVLTKEESAEWLENLKTNLPADVWRVVELREVGE